MGLKREFRASKEWHFLSVFIASSDAERSQWHRSLSGHVPHHPHHAGHRPARHRGGEQAGTGIETMETSTIPGIFFFGGGLAALTYPRLPQGGLINFEKRRRVSMPPTALCVCLNVQCLQCVTGTCSY